LPQLLEIVGRHRFHRHRLGFDLLHFGELAVDFRLPLGGAAKRRSVRRDHRLTGQHGVEGQARVLNLDDRFALRVVDAALVLQLAILIEDEDVRVACAP